MEPGGGRHLLRGVLAFWIWQMLRRPAKLAPASEQSCNPQSNEPQTDYPYLVCRAWSWNLTRNKASDDE